MMGHTEGQSPNLRNICQTLMHILLLQWVLTHLQSLLSALWQLRDGCLERGRVLAAGQGVDQLQRCGLQGQVWLPLGCSSLRSCNDVIHTGSVLLSAQKCLLQLRRLRGGASLVTLVLAVAHAKPCSAFDITRMSQRCLRQIKISRLHREFKENCHAPQ